MTKIKNVINKMIKNSNDENFKNALKDIMKNDCAMDHIKSMTESEEMIVWAVKDCVNNW